VSNSGVLDSTPMYILLLEAAAPIAWLAGRVMPKLIRLPWLAGLLGLACLVSPFVFGGLSGGRFWRIAIRGGGIDPSYWYWIPGYFGLLFTLAALVFVAERLRHGQSTRGMGYAVGYGGLFWLAMALLLSQPDPALAILLLLGALGTVLLARPRPLAALATAVILILALGSLLSLATVRGVFGPPEDCGVNPPAQEHNARHWEAAGWWGGPPSIHFADEQARKQAVLDHVLDRDADDPPPELCLPLTPLYLLNAAVQLHGWMLAAVAIAVALLHCLALFQLARRARSDEHRLERLTALVYASLPLSLLILSSVASAGRVPERFPGFNFPWMSGASDLSFLYAQAWLTGTAFGLARSRRTGSKGPPGS